MITTSIIYLCILFGDALATPNNMASALAAPASPSNCMEHQNKILEELKKSNNDDVIYLDFAKAFDKLDHGILLNRNKKIGINGKVGLWIHNFLSN